MKYFKILIGIFIALAASRFIPHPPNFTSLLALSFYVPALLGKKYIPALVFSFILTDFFIGFHSVTLFTWGSVILIGLASKFFLQNIIIRICGALFGAIIFYIISNFGVWLVGHYSHESISLISIYILALPFFAYSLISTIIFSSLIETVFYFYKKKFINT